MPAVKALRFDRLVLPHLDSAYNLARWLLGDPATAQDAVQEAVARALRYIDSLQGDDARAWFLAIVRHACFAVLERRRSEHAVLDFDSQAYESALEQWPAPARQGPLEHLEQQRLRQRIDAAIAALSPPLREAIVLRELEGLDYAQIAQVSGIALGTVMSRLSRAREHLRQALRALDLEP